MKRLFLALGLLMVWTVTAVAQQNCVDLQEIDGSPRAPCVKKILVSNGTLVCSATNVCTLTTGGGGGGNVTAGGTLTANLPVIGAGGTAVAVGTRSGNTTAFVTTTGSLTSGRCVEIDASGNFIESAAPCGGAGATLDVGTSTVTNGTAGRVFYETAGNVLGQITGATSDGTTLTLVAPVLGAATATSITASAAGVNFSGTNTTDAASLQLMLLRGNRATVTTNDEIYISFSLANASAAQKEVGRITTAIFPNTAGAEGGRIDFSVADSGTLAKTIQLSPGDLSPSNDNVVSLGENGTLQWSDLFLGSGGVISFDNSNVVLTHSAGILTMGTGELRITTPGTNAASVPTLSSSSTLSNKTLATGTIFAGYSDIAEIAAPANPSAGSIRLYADSGTGDLACLNSAGGDCLPSGSGSPGGADTQLQYNNAGNFGGISGATSNGTNVTFGSGNLIATSPSFSGTVAMAAATATGTIVQTSASATAFESGPNGSTNPVFRLVNSTASQADGVSVTGAAAGSGTTFRALSSGSNSPLLFTPKGTGSVVVNVSSGSVANGGLKIGSSGVNTGFWETSSYLGVDVGGTNVAGWRSGFMWLSSSFYIGWGGSTSTVSLHAPSAGVLRLGQQGTSSTAAGNLIIGTSAGAIGTSGAGVLAFTLSTTPSTSPTDTVQLYSADAAAADHNTYWRNEAGEVTRATGLGARNSSSFAKTTDTTLATITGLSRNVEAGRTYAFTAVMQTTAAATGGVKFAVSGTATATAISYEGILQDATVTVAQTRATALDTTVCASTTSTAGTCTIRGVIQVNAAGTFVIQFAQNASDGGASTVLANQYFQLIPIS